MTMISIYSLLLGANLYFINETVLNVGESQNMEKKIRGRSFIIFKMTIYWGRFYFLNTRLSDQNFALNLSMALGTKYCVCDVTRAFVPLWDTFLGCALFYIDLLTDSMHVVHGACPCTWTQCPMYTCIEKMCAFLYFL